MKINYLILAHNNFLHLDRLIEALNDKEATFFIHIDRKVKSPYNSKLSNVVVIPEKISINWGGFSMIKATLALLKHSMEISPDSDYFILLSGVDYPIRRKEFLYDLLTQKKEYIEIAPVPVVEKPLSRYNRYYFDYDRRKCKRNHILYLIESLLTKIKHRRRLPFKVYAGSQWFALSKNCISYILDTLKKDKRYVNFFKYTLIPDEAFFQTIIGNSSFLEDTVPNLTYADWQVPVPPSLIEDRHVDYLKSHREYTDVYGKHYIYFARKFNDDSTDVIKRIQEELWND